MNDLPEKSKRKVKPVNRLRRILIGVNIVVLPLAAIWFLIAATMVCGCSGPTIFDKTMTAISLTNAQVAVLLTQTNIAITAQAIEMEQTREARQNRTATAADAATIALTSDSIGMGLNMQATFDAAATASAVYIMAMNSDPSVTPTPVPYMAQNCSWMWAYQDDPATAQQIEAALDNAQIAYLAVRVSEDGEDQVCQDTVTPSKTFHLMQRSIYITLPYVTTTPAGMGAQIELVLRAIQSVTIDRARFLQITFDMDMTSAALWSMIPDDAYEALNTGTTGAALFEAGQPGGH